MIFKMTNYDAKEEQIRSEMNIAKLERELDEHDAPLGIRRAPNACCPDCNIHGGYCYAMHNYILESYKEKVNKFIDFVEKYMKIPKSDAIYYYKKKELLGGSNAKR